MACDSSAARLSKKNVGVRAQRGSSPLGLPWAPRDQKSIAVALLRARLKGAGSAPKSTASKVKGNVDRAWNEFEVAATGNHRNDVEFGGTDSSIRKVPLAVAASPAESIGRLVHASHPEAGLLRSASKACPAASVEAVAGQPLFVTIVATSSEVQDVRLGQTTVAVRRDRSAAPSSNSRKAINTSTLQGALLGTSEEGRSAKIGTLRAHLGDVMVAQIGADRSLEVVRQDLACLPRQHRMGKDICSAKLIPVEGRTDQRRATLSERYLMSIEASVKLQHIQKQLAKHVLSKAVGLVKITTKDLRDDGINGSRTRAAGLAAMPTVNIRSDGISFFSVYAGKEVPHRQIAAAPRSRANTTDEPHEGGIQELSFRRPHDIVTRLRSYEHKLDAALNTSERPGKELQGCGILPSTVDTMTWRNADTSNGNDGDCVGGNGESVELGVSKCGKGTRTGVIGMQVDDFYRSVDTNLRLQPFRSDSPQRFCELPEFPQMGEKGTFEDPKSANRGESVFAGFNDDGGVYVDKSAEREPNHLHVGMWSGVEWILQQQIHYPHVHNSMPEDAGKVHSDDDDDENEDKEVAATKRSDIDSAASPLCFGGGSLLDNQRVGSGGESEDSHDVRQEMIEGSRQSKEGRAVSEGAMMGSSAVRVSKDNRHRYHTGNDNPEGNKDAPHEFAMLSLLVAENRDREDDRGRAPERAYRLEHSENEREHLAVDKTLALTDPPLSTPSRQKEWHETVLNKTLMKAPLSSPSEGSLPSKAGAPTAISYFMESGGGSSGSLDEEPSYERSCGYCAHFRNEHDNHRSYSDDQTTPVASVENHVAVRHGDFEETANNEATYAVSFNVFFQKIPKTIIAAVPGLRQLETLNGNLSEELGIEPEEGKVVLVSQGIINTNARVIDVRGVEAARIIAWKIVLLSASVLHSELLGTFVVGGVKCYALVSPMGFEVRRGEEKHTVVGTLSPIADQVAVFTCGESAQSYVPRAAAGEIFEKDDRISPILAATLTSRHTEWNQWNLSAGDTAAQTLNGGEMATEEHFPYSGAIERRPKQEYWKATEDGVRGANMGAMVDDYPYGFYPGQVVEVACDVEDGFDDDDRNFGPVFWLPAVIRRLTRDPPRIDISGNSDFPEAACVVAATNGSERRNAEQRKRRRKRAGERVLGVVVGYDVCMLDRDDVFTQDTTNNAHSSNDECVERKPFGSDKSHKCEVETGDEAQPNNKPNSITVNLLDVRALRSENIRQPPLLSTEIASLSTGSRNHLVQRRLALERPLDPRDLRVGTVCTAWIPASNHHERAVIVEVAPSLLQCTSEAEDELAPREARVVTSTCTLLRPPGTVTVRVRDIKNVRGTRDPGNDADGSSLALDKPGSMFCDASGGHGAEGSVCTTTIQLPVQYLFTRPLIEDAPYIRVFNAKFTPTGELKAPDFDLRYLPAVIEEDDETDAANEVEESRERPAAAVPYGTEGRQSACLNEDDVHHVTEGDIISYEPSNGPECQVCATNDGEVEAGVLEVVQRAIDAAERACTASDKAHRLSANARMPNGEKGVKCVRSTTGEVYVGQTVTGPGATAGAAVHGGEVPHGLGRIVFKDGNEYSGEWRHGLKHGVGEFLFPDGEFYAGTYQKNSMSGYGLYIYTTGDIYEVIILTQNLAPPP